MKIYTKQGDEGATHLLGGTRVSKADLRVDAYGALDELNAVLGWVRVAPLPQTLDDFLLGIQQAAFRLGALLAAGPGAEGGVTPITDNDVEAMEQEIDRLEAGLPELRAFILPGGGETGARPHVARTVCRRAERAVVRLAERESVGPVTLKWMNRLSDLLFVSARVANAHEGIHDVLWTQK
ncbi:MAG: cob(I)yrinic acid a,c-diamide adenosyltransferase [Planctomycetota bacterium]|jgi:cob(I)alamin adenosyltransferase